MVHMMKVSICIPAYNNEPSVRRLLESIERQNFKDYEVIITDDSVTDGIKKLAEEKRFVLAFPNPLECGWNAELSNEGPDDLAAIDGLLDEVTKEDDLPIKCSWSKIPELSEMLRQWHLWRLHFRQGPRYGE